MDTSAVDSGLRGDGADDLVPVHGGAGRDDAHTPLIFVVDAVTCPPAPLHVLPHVLVHKIHQYLLLTRATAKVKRVGTALVPLGDAQSHVWQPPRAAGTSCDGAAPGDAADSDAGSEGGIIAMECTLAESSAIIGVALEQEQCPDVVLVTNDDRLAPLIRDAGVREMRITVVSQRPEDGPLAAAAARFVAMDDVIAPVEDFVDVDAAEVDAAIAAASAANVRAASAERNDQGRSSGSLELAVAATVGGGAMVVASGCALAARCRENVPAALATATAALATVVAAVQASSIVTELVAAARALFGDAATAATRGCDGLLEAAPSCARFAPLEPVRPGVAAAVSWVVGLVAAAQQRLVDRTTA
uniref:Uncharacterized protein n=1 Tax=Neobodo designis TaxID=312471 RepID=A0A7S1W2V7_NEODS|eukprot:CAMPEP_0174828688 /NCGR_PEP_ID=MMETSP1114-20130205/1485_1 /TAXON_ID=312471 /ORGANISM="Neobodo designis, Strain CCAP 1951/1" /LENGTH=359 /DNA_ID=CAMNT_0016062411 /DNA_START=55 /DNA_END=1134 /DNA_ORIENTATION=+